MTIGPRTDREKLMVEAAHLQGYAEGYADGATGVQSITRRLRERSLQSLAILQMSEQSDMANNSGDKQPIAPTP